jgi:hypothetical protein
MGPARERTNSGNENGEVEGLAEVIVGAEPEAIY